jgi:hypothetical protein
MLWLNKFKKKLKVKMTESMLLNIQEGHKVGDIALTHPKFKNGFMVDEIDRKKALEESKKAFKKHSIAYEYAIHHVTENGLQLYLRADILQKEDRKYNLVEVKSATSQQEVHFWDIAFQAYVMKKSNKPFNKLLLMKPSADYIQGKNFDIKKFFKVVDVTDIIVKEYLPKVEGILEKMVKSLNNKNEPQKVLGSHCKNPWACPFSSHCKKNINEDSVEKLSRLSNKKRIAFRKHNIKYIQQIPDNFENLFNELKTPAILSPKQQIQLEVAVTGEDHVDLKFLKAFIKSVKFPIHHLDFEAYNKAIPDYEKMKPHQFVTFQASLHIESKSGKLKHFEYIQDNKSDPRMAMIKFLLESIGQRGSILVFNKSFEQSRIKELAKDYPKFKKRLLSLNDRMVDLEVPFKKAFYTHKFEGRSSIKVVLPVLVPELSYDRMEITNGADAQAIYRNLIDGKYHTKSGNKGKEFYQVKKNLLDYCKLDTYAMVMIYRKLILIVSEYELKVAKLAQKEMLNA